jgi:hypothetical protein
MIYEKGEGTFPLGFYVLGPAMRSVLFTACLVLSLCSTAQQQVRITDVHVLDSPLPVRKSRGAEAALQAAGITAEQQGLVLLYGDDEHWPLGLKNDSSRKANEAYIQNYACFRVATYPEDSVVKSIIMLPAKDNIHMPEAMRPLVDLYLVVPERGLAEVSAGKPRPEISPGPKWRGLPAAKILKPEELYATYDLADDTIALAAMAKHGMSPAEINAVVFRSTDRNWPDGIDTFDERQKLLSKFTKYKAFVGAQWGEKVLLVIPVQKNKKQPILMRPYVDLYFVYNKSALQIKEKKRKK